jgi:hypothetical protein
MSDHVRKCKKIIKINHRYAVRAVGFLPVAAIFVTLSIFNVGSGFRMWDKDARFGPGVWDPDSEFGFRIRDEESGFWMRNLDPGFGIPI